VKQEERKTRSSVVKQQHRLDGDVSLKQGSYRSLTSLKSRRIFGRNFSGTEKSGKQPQVWRSVENL